MNIGDFEIVDAMPELKDPHVIAMLRPWVDVGNVGSLAMAKLENHLGAKELGRLAKPGKFFDFTRYRPTTRLVEERRILTIPNTLIYYAQREQPPDLLFFHLLEPHAFAEEYTECILEIIEKLGVKQHVRIGGMYDAVPHTRPLMITGSATGRAAEEYSSLLQLEQSSYQGATSIMNLVGDGLDKLSIDNISIMVHLPQYVQVEEDYAGTARLLEVLCSIYNLPQELCDAERGQRQYRELSNQVGRTSGLKSLIERLEAYYDSRTSGTPEETTKLSPAVENFLREMGERFQP